MKNDEFTFLISLSVLNHLGRHLYRSFATVLGEAISNSWDADAKNVWIEINRQKNSFLIKDDGTGMTGDDFQKKFLKIGYSKRKEGTKSPQRRRPFVGRKGIGKLALLSCAKKISIISKVKGGDYIGGAIDNSNLDRAITDDLTPQEYPLERWKTSTFGKHVRGHRHGTIVYFQDTKEGIRSSFDFLKKIVALYFRFSLLDKSFSRRGPRNLDSRISVISARRGDGIARWDGEEDDQEIQTQSRGGIQGQGRFGGSTGREDGVGAGRAVRGASDASHAMEAAIA